MPWSLKLSSKSPRHKSLDRQLLCPDNIVSALSAYDDLYEILALVQRVRRRLGLFTERHKTVPPVLLTGLKCFSNAVIQEMKLLRAPRPQWRRQDIHFRMEGPNCSRMPGSTVGCRRPD